MARRVFYTVLALVLAVAAFCGADPTPDINLFGVLFLFFGFVAWFCWGDIQAGFAYLEDSAEPRGKPCALIAVRFAPMHLRELTGKRPHRA